MIAEGRNRNLLGKQAHWISAEHEHRKAVRAVSAFRPRRTCPLSLT
jgi:hypothetical protein